jgi:hypothetical protein
MMRFYNSHRFYCGVELHARRMYLCILDQAGETLLHRRFPADREPSSQVVSRFGTSDGMAVAVEIAG